MNATVRASRASRAVLAAAVCHTCLCESLRLRVLCVCLAALGTIVLPFIALAKEQPAGDEFGPTTFPQAQPEDLGIRIPAGEPKPGGDRRVTVLDGDAPVVAKVHVEVGDAFIVFLPDGRLTSVSKDRVTLTDRPFEPASKKELIASLEERFPGFEARTTRRYLYVYNCSDAFRKATGRILETMYPALFAYVERQKIPVHDPSTLLVVVIFKTQDEFEKYRRMPEGVAAYYNGVSNRIIMYEQSRTAVLAPELAVKQSISTIAHEGVHQILHNIGVQKRLSRWPMWISEGLPEYFAPTEIGRRTRWKGVGLTNDLRMYSLIRHLEQTGNAPGGLSLAETVSAETLNPLGYAKSWALVHYLAKRRRQDFFKYLRAVSELEPLASPPPPGKLFTEHFSADYATLQRQMYKHLSKVKYVDPIANQTHYVAMFENHGIRQYVVTVSPTGVRAFRRRMIGPGQFHVQAFGNKAAAERFAAAWLQRR